MWKLIKFLFTGSWHEHNWKVLNKTKIYNYDSLKNDMPSKIEYILQCKECGDLKRTRG